MHRTVRFLADLARDTRHAARAITRMPFAAAVIALSLGAGVGVNTIVFSWLQAVILQPLPGVPAASRIHLVEARTETGTYPGFAWLEYEDVRARARTFEDLIAFRMSPLYVGKSGEVERAYGLLVSRNYFTALGLRPALGRFFDEADAARGAPPAVVISHDYWRNRFAAGAEIVGTAFRVNGRDMTIIGVAPEGFQGTMFRLNFDLWIPAAQAPFLLNGSRELDDRGIRGYSVIGRLAPGATRADAQGELDVLMRDLSRTYPQGGNTQGEVLPFWRAPRGPQRFMASAVTMMQGVMLLLLVMVCGNSANLMLARGSARTREMAVRVALGAARGRIVSLVTIECVVLGLAGGLLGALIAVWGTQAINVAPVTMGLPVSGKVSVNEGGIAFAILLGVLSGALFGAAPAVHLSRADLKAGLRGGVSTAAGGRLRNTLMAVQVALALVVLAAAGVSLRSFVEARTTDPGFRQDGVLLATYDLSGRNLSDETIRGFAARVLERVRALPQIEAAAIAASVPLDIHGMPVRGLAIEGRSRPDGQIDHALANTVTPGYFETLGIPIVSGADFAGLRDGSAPPQAIVNEEFVRRFLPDAIPVGRRIDIRGRTYTIIGVVRNSLYEAFGETPKPIVHLSYRDRPALVGEVHVRTRPGAGSAAADDIRRIIAELEPSLPVYNVRTLTEHIENNLVFRRVPARMFAVLGPLLLALAALGIYAVVAYNVSRRTSEIGVRMVLGATTGRVVRQLTAESMSVVGVGAIAGWALAFALSTALVPQRALDAAVLVGVPAMLLGTALLACWIPARRASRIAPLAALRVE